MCQLGRPGAECLQWVAVVSEFAAFCQHQIWGVCEFKGLFVDLRNSAKTCHGVCGRRLSQTAAPRHLILVVQLGSHGPTVCVNGRKLRLFWPHWPRLNRLSEDLVGFLQKYLHFCRMESRTSHLPNFSHLTTSFCVDLRLCLLHDFSMVRQPKCWASCQICILVNPQAILFNFFWNSGLDIVFLQAKMIQNPIIHCDAPMTSSVLTPKSMPSLTAEVVVAKMVVPPQKY